MRRKRALHFMLITLALSYIHSGLSACTRWCKTVQQTLKEMPKKNTQSLNLQDSTQTTKDAKSTDREHAVSTHNYVQTHIHDNSISVYFNIEEQKASDIGDRMCEINEKAYMNGYNWDAFFNYYLAKNAPHILEGMAYDSEAGSYVVYYDYTEENKGKAKSLENIIIRLIENEEELYRIIHEDGDKIEWE